MFVSVNEEAHRHLLLDELVDFRENRDAISKEDAFVVTSVGTK